MKRVRTILLKAIMFIMAFQILNLSIDVDHIAFNSHTSSQANFDDMDSFTEYLIEKIAGDDQYISEDDNDEASPQEKVTEKCFLTVLYFEPANKFQLNYCACPFSARTSGKDPFNKTCSGYFNLTSPPPEI